MWKLTRNQILHFRQKTGCLLAERLPHHPDSLRRAAWAGLQDSMPRAALLSLHARVANIHASSWEAPPLVQLWGPRFNDYVVAAQDVPVFTLGRLPDAGSRRYLRAMQTAAKLRECLKGRRMPFGEAGQALGVPHNSLRYAALTGTVLLRWDGARQPVIFENPAAAIDHDPAQARLELARRYLHLFAPGTASAFAHWAGTGPAEAASAFRGLEAKDETIAVKLPNGESASILATDEDAFRSTSELATVRLLPSGDAYFLLWGSARELLVPDAAHRAQLWTTRVWPGAVLVNGEIVGVWRRAGGKVSIDLWRKLKPAETQALEAEALGLPLGLPKLSVERKRYQ